VLLGLRNSDGSVAKITLGTGLSISGNTLNGPTATSGTYTPTKTNVANVSGSTAYVTAYYRVGNVVTVSGRLDISVTTGSTITTIRLSLPIASNFTDATQCSGHLTSDSNLDNGAIYSDATNDQAFVSFRPANTGSRNCFFTFTYQVL
jgi:hypothetical protein